MKDWIVVANQASCDVFEQTKKGYKKKCCLANPEVKMKGIEIFSDRQGRSQNSHSSSRVGLEERHYQEDLDKKFAKKITNYLDQERHLGSFDNLTVVSGPSFIGYLREAASKELQNTIGHEVVKNISARSKKDLDQVLKGAANE